MRAAAGCRSLPVLATLAALSAVPLAEAVCPKPAPRVCAEFFDADAVFIGRVLDARTEPPRGNTHEGWTYRVRVSRRWRGAGRSDAMVFTENSSGRLPLEVGREYLLFASVTDGRLEITHCGNSGPVGDRADRIEELERLRGAKGAVIEGHVAARPDWTGVPSIEFRVLGEGRTYTAVSGPDGWFRVPVPPGKYTVKAQTDDVDPFDLSYDDPESLRLQRGECAELQFVKSN